MKSNYDKFTDKIIKNKDNDLFIIFYSDWCKYSMKAIDLLKNSKLSFKGYKIDKIRGKLERLLHNLQKYANITAFDIKHRTRPIIFYHGRFIGGYSELYHHLLDSKFIN